MHKHRGEQEQPVCPLTHGWKRLAGGLVLIVGLSACTSEARVDRRLRCRLLSTSERSPKDNAAWDQIRCDFDYPGNYIVEEGPDAAAFVTATPAYRVGTFRVWGVRGERVTSFLLESIDGQRVNIHPLGAGSKGVVQNPFPSDILGK